MSVVYMKFCSRVIVIMFGFLSASQSFRLSRCGFIRNAGSSVMSTATTLLNDNNSPEEQNSLAYSVNKPPDFSYPLTIDFYSPVTIESCMALTNYLKQLDIKSKQLQIQYGKVFPIKLHIQSGGGMLMPTFYVCDVIQNLDTPVYVYIDGFVASAASLIAVSGKKKFMTKHSFMLIHQLQSQSSGRLNEMKDEITNLDFFMKNAKDIYYKNSNITAEMLEKLLSDELWIDAEQCMYHNLVDEII